jgi:predicted nucleic acid-binding protein
LIKLAIANSSPFIGLGRISRLDLLEGQFERLLAPEAVADEVGGLPGWVEVAAVADRRLLDAFPSKIHRGEAEVILLGIGHPGAVLVMDDWRARQFAQDRGFTLLGTVGLLLRAKRLGRLTAVRPILDELSRAGFRVSERVVADALRVAGE